MKTLLLGLVMVVALPFAPARAADDCTMRQTQIDKMYGKRFDRQAAKVRSIALEGSRLCKSGKVSEGLAKYDMAAKEGGVMMDKNKK
ncbi:MAG TPA: hypothetical protein VLK28_02335 [Methylomirabilota bacterium]|nr:hypothetical protein [Methylomirabilota bacterium]